MKKNIHFLIGVTVGWVSIIQSVYAQLPDESGEKTSCLKTGDCHLSDIPSYIHYIASGFVGLGATISVIMFIIGGYQWIMGGMSDDMKNKARKTIKLSIVGLVVTLLSWTIVMFLQFNLSGNS